MTISTAPGTSPVSLGARAGRIALGSLAWGLLMGASAAVSLVANDWRDNEHIRLVAGIFAAGGALAWFSSQLATRYLPRAARRETRLAVHLLALAALTIGLTAAIYALRHRQYFAQWHEPALTVGWLFQFVFTTIGALYQFAVLGLPLYLPIGLPALLAVSLWQSARAR